jgi:hypothetical protein
MTDISKCNNLSCPRAGECYRIQAKSNPFRQSVTDYTNICNKENGYEFFMQNYKNKIWFLWLDK